MVLIDLKLFPKHIITISIVVIVVADDNVDDVLHDVFVVISSLLRGR